MKQHSEAFLRKKGLIDPPEGELVSPGVDKLPEPTDEEKKNRIVEGLKNIARPEGGEPEESPRKRRKKRADKPDESQRRREQQMATLAMFRDMWEYYRLPLVEELVEVAAKKFPVEYPPPTDFEKHFFSVGAGMALVQNFENFEEHAWKIFLFGGAGMIFVPRILKYLKEQNDRNNKAPQGDTHLRQDGEREKPSGEAADQPV